MASRTQTGQILVETLVIAGFLILTTLTLLLIGKERVQSSLTDFQFEKVIE
jgi:hypothetical protein